MRTDLNDWNVLYTMKHGEAVRRRRQRRLERVVLGLSLAWMAGLAVWVAW